MFAPDAKMSSVPVKMTAREYIVARKHRRSRVAQILGSVLRESGLR